MKYLIKKMFTAPTLLSGGSNIEFTEGNVIENIGEIFTAEQVVAHVEAGELEAIVEHTVTEEDLDNNPYFASLGAEVGEVVGFDPATVLTREDAIAVGIDVEAIEADALANKKDEVYTGPMAKYKITGVADYTDEAGTKTGELEIGSIQELPVPVGDVFVGQGVAEKIVEAPAEVEPKKFYEGKLVVVDSYRTVNDKQYHHIRLEDGTTQDLTNEQYDLGVKVEVK